MLAVIIAVAPVVRAGIRIVTVAERFAAPGIEVGQIKIGPFPIAERRVAGVKWWVRADAFNVFNNASVTEVDEAGEYSWFEPNEHYGQPMFYQAARTVRLGFGLSF